MDVGWLVVLFPIYANALTLPAAPFQSRITHIKLRRFMIRVCRKTLYSRLKPVCRMGAWIVKTFPADVPIANVSFLLPYSNTDTN